MNPNEMQPIFLFRESAEDHDALAQISSVKVEDGVLTVGYEDDTVRSEPCETDDGILHLVAMPNDEIYVDRSPREHLLHPQTGDEIAEVLSLWIGTYGPLSPEGAVLDDVRIEDGSLIMTGEGWTDMLPLTENGKPLRAIWHGEQFVGFDIPGGRGELIDEAMVERIRARFVVMRARVAMDWHVVKDECVRLGSEPPVDLKPGNHVKIGFQPDHPMPDDPNAEWMWVELTEVSEDGARLTGILRNHPTMVGIAHGDSLEFSNRDVYAVER